MRLLHPRTMRIIAVQCKDEDFKNATVTRKTALSSAWSEVYKFMGGKRSHPKMFIDDEFILGVYAAKVFRYGSLAGCDFKATVVQKYSDQFIDGFCDDQFSFINDRMLMKHFDDMYLFSDACSLYFKGLNIFPYIFGDDWRKFVPVESHKEILRQVTKKIDKED